MKLFELLFRIVFFGTYYMAKFWWITIPLIIIIGVTVRRKTTIRYWRAYWEEEKRWKEEQDNKK